MSLRTNRDQIISILSLYSKRWSMNMLSVLLPFSNSQSVAATLPGFAWNGHSLIENIVNAHSH